MKAGRDRYVDLALLSAMGLLPLLWFREGYGAVAGFDFSVYLNPVDTLKRSMYLWSDRMANGYDISHEISSIPYYLLFSIPILLKASLYTAEKFVFSALFALQGLSIYYMLGVFYRHNPSRRFISLTGAVLYSFSYPVMAHFGRGNFMALLTYALIPALLGLLSRGFDSRERSGRYVMLITLISFPIAAAKGHPADFLVLLGVAMLFTAFHAMTSERDRALHILRFSLKAALSASLFNLWWIVPNILYLGDFGLSKREMLNQGFYNLELLDYYSNGTSILNLFRNERLDLWFDIPGDTLMNAGLYQTPLFIAIGLGLSITAYLALMRRSVDRNTVFLSMLGLIAIFLAKGSHEPYGWIYKWLYLRFPGFFLLRAPYRVFSSLFTFSLAPLAAVSLSFFIERIKGDIKAQADHLGKLATPFLVTPGSFVRVTGGLLVSFLILASCLYAWPLFTGTHLRKRGTAREPGVFHNIPPEYYQAEAWLKGAEGERERGEEDGFKLYYPYEVYDSNTVWGYNGPDPSFEILTTPKVAARPGGTVYIRYQKPIESLNSVIRGWSYGDLRKVLALYNARYVLIHQDFSPWVLPDYNFNEYVVSLLERNGINHKKSLGPLVFFENKGYAGRFNSASKGYLLAGDERAFPALSVSGYLDSPFLVMARDLEGKADFEKALGAMDGVIFHDSNTTDLICSILWKKNSARHLGAALFYSSEGGGVHYVFMKTATGQSRESRMARSAEGAEDGFEWAMIAEEHLEKGENSIALTGEKAVLAGARDETEFIVIEKAVFQEMKRRLSGRMGEKGFDAVYLFDRASGGALMNLSGGSGHTLKSNRAQRYVRRSVNAFGRGSGKRGPWAIRGGSGRAYLTDEDVLEFARRWKGGDDYTVTVSRDAGDVEIGRFPILHLDKGRFLKGAGSSTLDVVMLVKVDGDTPPERFTIRDEDIAGGGGLIDIEDGVRKEFGWAGKARLKKIELKLTLKKDGMRRGTDTAYLYAMRAPSLTGEFDLIEAPCTGEAARGLTLKRVADGAEIRASGDAPCGRPVVPGARVIGEGDYLVTFGKKGEEGQGNHLVLIEKNPAGRGALRGGGDIGYKRINPTRYEVAPEGGKPRLVIFNDSHNRGWTLRSGKSVYTPFKVNGFANGFVLDMDNEGDYVVEYTPQRFYALSRVISVAALSGVIAAGLTTGRA